ncbi:chemotaxis protein CheW [Candidatus Pyrohabitans sp.]
MLHLAEKEISPPPVGGEREFVKGVGKIKEKLMILLDIDKMITNREIEIASPV